VGQQFVRDPIELMFKRNLNEAFGIEDNDADLDEPRPPVPDKTK